MVLVAAVHSRWFKESMLSFMLHPTVTGTITIHIFTPLTSAGGVAVSCLFGMEGVEMSEGSRLKADENYHFRGVRGHPIGWLRPWATEGSRIW